MADENLSGQVYFEIGKSIWGKADNPQGGMALGADASIVKLKRAFIDWRVPNTDIKLRMGIQGLGLPYMAMDAPTVFQSDVAAITGSYVFNENAAMTAFWARPYNDNYMGDADGYQKNFMDNMDMAGLIVPLTFDGFKLTPWGLFASIGSNTFRKNDNYVGNKINGVNGGYALSGLFPLRADLMSHKEKLNAYGTAWWGGLSGAITKWDPFRIAWDFTYGSVSYDDGSLNRSGWLAALLLEYITWTGPSWACTAGIAPVTTITWATVLNACPPSATTTAPAASPAPSWARTSMVWNVIASSVTTWWVPGAWASA